MKENIENVKRLARDLRNDKEFPRSPRETPRGYVLAARALDKCRAALVGWQDEYDSNCPLDQQWLKFAEIDCDHRPFLATGATDNEFAAWIGEHAKKRPRADIIVWNNRQRDLLERPVAGSAGIHGGHDRVSRPTPPRVVPICRCVRRGGNAVLNWTEACHPIPLRLPDEPNTWLRRKL